MPRPLPSDPLLRDLVLRARSAQINRRRLLQVGAAGAGALTLAACSAPGGGDPSKPTIRWGNWDGYIDEDENGDYPTLDKFTEATGIAVDYSLAIEDNDEFYAIIKDQLALGTDTGYDVFCLTDWMIGRLVRDGQVQDLDLSAMPNVEEYLAPSLREVDFDPGRKKSIPWQSGFAGLTYDSEALPNGIRTVEDLWAPELKGRVVVLSEMRDTLGIVMQSLGTDISGDFSSDDFYNALDVVDEMVKSGQILAVQGNSYTDLLERGDAVAGIVWSGDVQGIINYNLEERGESPRYEFVIPESGGTLWSDNFTVPNASTIVGEVQELINHYYDPAIAAELAAWVNYVTPCTGAKEAAMDIDPELAENPLIFPDEETLAKVNVFRGLTEAEEAEYSSAWSDLKVGA